ncbi:MAG: response regulator, partial [Pirellula sp.]
MNRVKVLIADDHRIVADGLRTILEPQYDLVGIAENGRSLVDKATTLEPDVVVADISMPSLNGLDAMEMLQKQNCKAKFIFLTMHKDITYAAKAIRQGAVDSGIGTTTAMATPCDGAVSILMVPPTSRM